MNKRISDNALIVMMFLVIGMSTIAMAFAVSGFQTYTKINVSGGPSSTVCSGITVLPVTNYVIQNCNSGGSPITYRVSQYDGTSINTTTNVVGGGTQDNPKCFAVTDTIGICGASTSSGSTGLKRITITSATTISVSDFTNPAAVAHSWSLSGSNLYMGASSGGNFYRVSTTTFTQTGSWTGLTTGTPTCTNVRYATSVSSGLGIAVCDTNTLISFSYDEGAGSGAITKLSSISLIGSYSSISRHMNIIYDGSGYLYVASGTIGMEAVAMNTSGTLTGTAIQYNIIVQDIKGGVGGYWVAITDNNQIYLLKKQGLTPPNNLVATQTIPTTLGVNSALNTNDSSNYVIAKGNNGNTTVFFIQALVLHNENDQAITSETTGTTTGVDCTDEANANILICRIVGTGVIGGSSGIINAGVLDILVSSGVISGEDTNPQTNGVGYIITFISLAVMTGIFFVFTHGHLKEVPTFIWVISTVAIIGTMTAIGWIDPTFLVISIIVIVALAAMQIRNTIGSSIDFASGGNF